MVRGLLLEDKKGVSIMIGYVLLVIIAIGLSVIVFAYLKLYLPKDEPKCEKDISLEIRQLECLNGEVMISLGNNGLFSADGAFIRIGEQGRIVKTLLNENNQLIGNVLGQGLKPNEIWGPISYPYTEIDPRELEVEPFIFVDNEAVLCPDATIERNIICS